ncbi:RNA-binding S4 domain-containing protein [Hyphococcus formosus]|uniref:RNA-binding S4 domain-containing protein n=1 Tax=Hyphococcus formosus TaxID=3143534 RepID=UPI00398BA7D6
MSVESAEAEGTTQRLDRWLWFARFFKTRTLAAKFVSDGNVRITRGDNTQRADKAATAIRPGDIIVFTRNDRTRIVTVLKCGNRRGPATEAQELYDDQSPPVIKTEATPVPFEREKGTGRPTKKDRRAISALRAQD